MKNKHLVFLFLLVLLGGLVFRRLPMRRATDFRREIVRIAPDSIAQIALILPNDSAETIVFSRRDAAWSASHGNRTVPIGAEKMQPLLASLASVFSSRLMPQTPENQRVFERHALRVQVFSPTKKLEEIALGPCHPAAKISLVRLLDSPEIFETETGLACQWSLLFDDLRSRDIGIRPMAETLSVEFAWSTDSSQVFEQKNDSLWQSPDGAFVVPLPLVQAFFQEANSLKISAFADDFDDTRRRELLVGRIVFRPKNAAARPVELTCFRSEKSAPRFVLHSSENPGNYFSTDDALTERIFSTHRLWLPKPPK